jgi:hypothetical protein
VLDSDTVHYCTANEVSGYELYIDVETGLIRDVNNQLVNTGSEGWIFVLNNGVIVAAEKKTSPPRYVFFFSCHHTHICSDRRCARSYNLKKYIYIPFSFFFIFFNSKKWNSRFHHSSFYAGGCVEVAGIMVINEGRLVRLYPHSGHYRPSEDHVRYMLQYLHTHGVDLSSFDVDVQHLMKVSRPLTNDGLRIKKRECPHYVSGVEIHSFLTVKVCCSSLICLVFFFVSSMLRQ